MGGFICCFFPLIYKVLPYLGGGVWSELSRYFIPVSVSLAMHVHLDSVVLGTVMILILYSFLGSVF